MWANPRKAAQQHTPMIGVNGQPALGDVQPMAASAQNGPDDTKPILVGPLFSSTAIARSSRPYSGSMTPTRTVFLA
jgi:hypothetical protein